jgi:hypothetical protein
MQQVAAAFCSETAGELMGFFVPGHAPVISSSRRLPPALTHAHEEGHQKLCLTTTVGYYASALGRVVPVMQQRDPSFGRKVEEDILKIVEGSWVTQEGYATLRQVAHLYKTDSEAEIAPFIDKLPDSYRFAVDLFLARADRPNIASVARSTKPAGLSPPNRGWNIGVSIDFVGYIAARLAMSPPLSPIFDAAVVLPCPLVASEIQSNSADSRIETALRGLDEGFVRYVIESCFGAMQSETKRRKSPREVTAETLDGVLDMLARELSATTGISYEPSFALQAAPVFQRILGIEMLETDSRRLPFSRSTADVEAHVATPARAVEMPMEDVRAIAARIRNFDRLASVRRFWFPRKSKNVTVVCELLPCPEPNQFAAFLYAYCDMEMLQDALRTAKFDLPDPPKDKSIAYPVAIGRTKYIYNKCLASLRGAVPGQRWYWLIGDPFVGIFRDAVTTDLPATGTVVVVGHDTSQGACEWASYELTPASHSMVKVDPLPSDLCLLIAPHLELGAGALVAKLGFRTSGMSEKDFGPSCLGDALYRCVTSQVLSPRKAGT